MIDFDQLKKNLKVPNQKDFKSFNEYYDAIEQYRKDEFNIILKFEEFFFSELGIRSNPRRTVFFAKCWELGHKEGYSKILNWGYTLLSIIT